MKLPKLKDHWKYNFTRTFWALYKIKNPMAPLMGLDFSRFIKKEENDESK